MRDTDELKPHFDAVVSAFRERNIIPFLGAGASLCDRGTAKWTAKQSRILPSTTELTNFLARRFKYPTKEPKELTRVTQYVDIMRGLGPLYETLNHIFDKDYELTSLHRFLASLPSRLKNVKPSESPVPKRFILITTNYDDLLERAFDEANQPYHKLVYMADKGEEGHRGRFLHWLPYGEGQKVIAIPNEYGDLEDHMATDQHERYPAIIKIHGAVDRAARNNPDDDNPENPSYVITEDHYIDFLMRADISNLLPKSLVATLLRSHFLFLGYGLRDWNLRVILRRIWQAQQTLRYKSWAIQWKTGQFDEKYWQRQEVEILDMDIGDYVRTLQSYMGDPHA